MATLLVPAHENGIPCFHQHRDAGAVIHPTNIVTGVTCCPHGCWHVYAIFEAIPHEVFILTSDQDDQQQALERHAQMFPGIRANIISDEEPSMGVH